jgi:RNA polymerase sigma factor (sigma-70 family)
MGLAIHTQVGTVVHTGDFKFDQTPVDGRGTDFDILARLGAEGVIALVSDSTRAEVPGYTPSERVVGETFRGIMSEAQGRVIVATFASNIARIQQVIDAAEALGRRVAVVGRSMEQNSKIAQELGLPESNWNVVRDTVLSNSQPTHSMSEDASSVFGDSLEDPNGRSPEEQMFATMELTRMRQLLDMLEPREARIVKLRYGIGSGEPMTLKAIGKKFGLTRERVRQMEQQALEKLYRTMSREFGEQRPLER